LIAVHCNVTAVILSLEKHYSVRDKGFTFSDFVCNKTAIIVQLDCWILQLSETHCSKIALIINASNF